ncbi:MAG TPA: FAD-dependent oxidoreductase, partial [Phototrophicaceae bacterium]|nr:FAD-dependent oxidoreductase [Phototrophicaceae bacterium]
LRDAGWYAQRDIDLRLKTTVSKIDPKAHTVALEGGETIRYDKLLLATGGLPRDLKRVPGGDLDGILTLRSLADADKILAQAKESQRVVIIGASFIGMEAAASLGKNKNLKLNVTVVDLVDLPFQKVLGDRIGKLFMDIHAANGVTFHLGAKIEGFTGANGRVNGVQIGGGTTLPADFVLIGVGVRPATDYLKDSGLKLDEKDASVAVNAQLQSSDPDIYAAGDIARYPVAGGTQRIEHWRTAQQHGVIAARGMLGQHDSVANHVPFFWTNQWGFGIRYVGHAEGWDEIIYRGTPENKDFVAFYVKDGALKAASGAKHDQVMDAIEFILLDGKPLTPEQMRDESFDLVAHAVS